MFDGMKRKLGVAILGSALKSLATSKDTQTTIGGMLAAAVIAVPGFDLGLLLSGDPQQIARVVSALLVVLIGFWATRAKADGKTTLAGTVAGVLYASAGGIGNVTTGLLIAVLGYFTNKPVKPEPEPKS